MFSYESIPLKRLVFWEPCVSPHKVDLFSALAATVPNIEVICCADSDLPIERQALGWSVKPTNSFRTVVAPSETEIAQLVCERLDATFHVFSGIHWVPNIVAGLKTVKRYNGKFCIMSEPRVREGWKGTLRLLHSWLTEGWLRRNAAFILAQGKNGPSWFRAAGYPGDRIFPFAYFVDVPRQTIPSHSYSSAADQPIHIGYVGRFVKMKGVFDLVEAVRKLGSSVQLSFVGAGPEEDALKAACNEFHINAKFIGILPCQEVGNFMRNLDILVLASTSKDGWGVVVSEALMCGTAVIATPCVGASLMLEDPLFGMCVAAESPDAIADAVRALKASSAFTAQARSNRELLARSRLSGESGARHFLDIVQWRFYGGPRPIPFHIKSFDVFKKITH